MSDTTQATFNIPQKHQAWLAARKGKPSDALERKDIDVPKLTKGEVLVKVQAGALNPVGYKLLGLLPNFVARRPNVAENDFAGVVVDANGSKWQNGQEVYGFIDVALQMKTHQGSLAQYIKIPAERLALRPPFLKPTEAAGLTLAGLTAYQALFHVGRLESGQSIFISGGTTTVGIFAIQIAKGLGCTVTASASTKKEELLKNLGVDRFIDYTKAPVHEQLEKDPPTPKFHLILDAVGQMDIPLYTHSEAYLAPGGAFVSVGPQPHGAGVLHAIKYIATIARPRFLGGTKRDWKLVRLNFNTKDWERFTQLIAEGKVKGLVDSVYSFEDVQKAYERIMTSRATGKVVVKVDSDIE